MKLSNSAWTEVLGQKMMIFLNRWMYQNSNSYLHGYAVYLFFVFDIDIGFHPSCSPCKLA